MAKEIERKFLLRSNEWEESISSFEDINQAYLCTEPGQTIRLRLAGTSEAWITVKGPSVGISRDEWEYSIPFQDATEMLSLCSPDKVINKRRWYVWNEKQLWEIDQFSGQNEGLIVAEAEIPSENHLLILPPWIGEEVTHDRRYSNSQLAEHPFREWE